jgi:hypothetical protein
MGLCKTPFSLIVQDSIMRVKYIQLTTGILLTNLQTKPIIGTYYIKVRDSYVSLLRKIQFQPLPEGDKQYITLIGAFGWTEKFNELAFARFVTK